MPTQRCYYEILSIEKTVDGAEIKRAYRKLALKFHPDNYKGEKSEGETKFKELAEAYEVLSDPQKRQQYDQFGHEGLRGSGMHDFSNMGFGDIFSMFEDIFGGMGGGRSRGVRDQGYDLETEVSLTLEEVSTGAERTLEFQRMDFCETCSGSGAKAGTSPEKCTTCGGYGQVQQQVSGFFGMSVRVADCPACKGSGKMVKEPCDDCNGTGRAKKQRILSVNIPAGVHDGQCIRVRNEGEPGRAGRTRGDMHVYVRITNHPLLQRNRDDLVCQVPLSFPVAAIGGVIEVPTLTETAEELQIPAGTQNHDVISLKGKGLPNLRSGRRGHLHIQVTIEVPKKLSKEQRELLTQYATLENDNITPKRKSFLDSIKDYFKHDGEE